MKHLLFRIQVAFWLVIDQRQAVNAAWASADELTRGYIRSGKTPREAVDYDAALDWNEL